MELSDGTDGHSMRVGCLSKNYTFTVSDLVLTMNEKFAPTSCVQIMVFQVDFASMEEFCTWGALVGQVLHNSNPTLPHSLRCQTLAGDDEGAVGLGL